jgi:hypothetical protein
MTSSDHSDELDLGRDLPTTDADIEALRRFRADQEISFAEALTLLSNFNPFPVEHSDRPLPTGWEPFSL